LAFPEVKVLDMLFASALLELMSACFVVIAFLIIAWFAGINPMPRDIVQAAYALGAAVLLGLGFGLFNGVIALAFPPWFTGYMLVYILLWVSAGIIFVPDALPAQIRDIAAHQPALQLVEWMRSAYYEGYGSVVLDRLRHRLRRRGGVSRPVAGAGDAWTFTGLPVSIKRLFALLSDARCHVFGTARYDVARSWLLPNLGRQCVRHKNNAGGNPQQNVNQHYNQ